MTRFGLHGWFSEDDLMNIARGWSTPRWELIRANLVFFNHYNRPLTELLLSGLYAIFGFNPLPFSVVRLILCAGCLVALYLFSSQLARSREAGLLSVMLAGFHPALNSLYFDSGMLYDVMAFLFYYTAFWMYLRGRRFVWVLLVFIAALDSKEIAVSFPAALLFYEVFVARRQNYWPSLVAGFVTLIYILGKNTGASALSARSAYHPRISLSGYLDNYAHYAADFLFYHGTITHAAMALVLTGCLALALLMRHRILIWAAAFNVVSILPLAFIPPRNGFAFFVPLAGWALYVSILLVWCRELIIYRRVNLRLPAQMAVAAALCWFVIRPETQIMNQFFYPVIHNDQFLNRDVWNSLQVVLPHPEGKRILALREPFDPGYSLYFMLQLGYGIPGVQVDTAALLEEHRQVMDVRQYDVILDYADRRFFRIR